MVEVSPLNNDIRKKLEASLTVILETFQAFGFVDQHYDLSKTLEHWVALAIDSGDWMKTAKYKLAAFFSFHKRQPLPKSPFKIDDKPNILLGGQAYRFQRVILNQENMKKEQFLATILLGCKKGMPRPVESDIIKKEEETFQHLTTEPNTEFKEEILIEEEKYNSAHPGVAFTLNQEGLISQLERTVDELFKDEEMNLLQQIKMFFPSTSANYINNIKEAGAIGTIMDHPELLKGLRKPGGWLKTTKVNDEKEEETIKTEEESQKLDIDISELEEKWETLLSRIENYAMFEEPNVELLGLAEALSVRVISKGPPLKYTFLRNIWKFIHSTLRKHKTFTLIGVPESEEILLNVLGAKLHEQDSFLSGDYQNASNNIYQWASNTVSNRIAKRLHLYIQIERMMRESLTGHIIYKRKNDIPAEQKMGQLMGSIMSFPVLCIINAAMCRWSLEIALNKPLQLTQCPLLINGDDVAMKTTEFGYLLWKKITTRVGLTESIGKTFFSKEFVQINSRNFLYKEDSTKTITVTNSKGESKIRSMPYSMIQFINWGLVSGLKRSGKAGLNDLTNPHDTIGARARQLQKLTPPELFNDLYRVFINKQRSWLEKTRIPWFIPEWLGGLGLPINSEFTPSETDLRIAHLILINWRKERPVSIAHQEAKWKTRIIAEKKMPEPYYATQKDANTDNYEKFLGLKCLDLLFDSNISLADLMEAEVKPDVSKALKKNSKLWTPKGKQLPSPLKIEDLQFLAKYPAYITGSLTSKYGTNFESSSVQIVSSKIKPSSLIGDLD